MKTIGERIRQARDAKRLSGEELAQKVGYKTQSGISNLESRATGSGGNKIHKIAQVLNVSVDWLMNGPDSENVPFLPNQVPQMLDTPIATLAREPGPFSKTAQPPEYDQWTIAAINLMQTLDIGQREAMFYRMREFKQYLGPPRDGQALSVAG